MILEIWTSHCVANITHVLKLRARFFHLALRCVYTTQQQHRCGNGRPPSEDYEVYHCDIGTLFDITTLIWNEERGGLVGSCVSAESVDCIADEINAIPSDAAADDDDDEEGVGDDDDAGEEGTTTMIISPTPTTTSASSLVTETTTTTTPSPTPVTESQQQTAGADEQQLFCASSMDELEASCTAAQSCISSACPKGMFCFPFTCATAAVIDTEDLTSSAPTPMAEATAGNQLQCPHSTFVGWHTSPDCKEYFECDNGEMGVVHMCNEGLKFDKVRNQCQDEMSVNSMCYGPAHTMSLSDGLCSDGYSGWESRNGCREYYWCDIGYADVVYVCGQDLLFDRSMDLCNFANQVHCVENGGVISTDDADVQLPAPVSVPTPLVSVPTPLTSQPSPLTGMTLTTITGKDPPPQAAETEQQLFCASSMTELDTASCATAQSCISGPCPKGMFCFPYTCNNEYVGVGGVVGNYNWSDTTTRPPLQNATSSIETPPWLANTVFTHDNAGVASTMEYTMIIIVLSFFLVI